ncbi:MAG: CoA transferase, partial [Marinosulfonomonas sp.]|nr:CoA transferase [Marinosulfonomonas sp.]
DDPMFATNPMRVRNRVPLIAKLEALFLKGSMAGFLENLEEFGVPCAPINDIANVFEDPQVQHRNLKIQVEHPAGGSIPMIANPIRFSEAELTYKAPPMLAEHTDDVLAELLNLDSDALEKLAADGIIQRRDNS